MAVGKLPTGWVVGLHEFRTAAEKTFDVKLLPGLRFAEDVGFRKVAIRHTFVVPGAVGAPAGRRGRPG
jgi:hypothetical protein